ncbi:MAG: DUF1549 and DUF1553 domain-containing protein [Planctomycetia bacterium]|nr:DUF1549 and DUF1553 domain-containing protein [Planctomycetia bacterium]
MVPVGTIFKAAKRIAGQCVAKRAAGWHRQAALAAILVVGASLFTASITPAAEPGVRRPVAVAKAGDASESAPESSKAAPGTSAPTGSASSYGLPQVRYINELIAKGWEDHNLAPSPPATDGEWCRRVYLDLLGRIPTVEELEQFTSDYNADKRARLVDRLLSDEFVEQYAGNWSTLWTNTLIGRAGGTERRTRTNRDGLQQYLRRSFQRNKPYDKLVSELISATGTSKPGTEGFNGAVNFLAMKLEDKGIQAAAQTSQVFLGVRMQCTQCHDHPFNNWQQDQFWQLESFFRQTAALRRFAGGREIAYIELVDQDFGGEGGDPEEAEVYYEQRNGLMKVAYPVFTDADGTKTDLPKSGLVNRVNRRQELAKLIVGSQWMPRAIVNRMWAHFLGYGFTKPLDDLGPHNPPSHPELMDHLAADFKASGYNLKELIRWIVLSQPYALSSRSTTANKSDDPTLGEKPMFSHFYLRQMRAEELYASLLSATAADKTRGSVEQQETERRKWLDQFVIAFGTDENDETTTFNGTIPQTLMMFNGEMIKRATSGEKGTLLERVASDNKLNTDRKIDFLFKAALSRGATPAERNAALRILGRRTNGTEALADLWWAILNMNEFILNH